MRRVIALGLALAAAMGCAHAVHRPGFVVPQGCEQDLSGTWVHAADPSYRYLASDDGGTLRLEVRRELVDGGTSPWEDPGGTQVVLARTQRGFLGATLSRQLNSVKARCPVALPAKVLRCTPDQLVIRAQDRTALNEACQPPVSGPAPQWIDERLVRLRPAYDAGASAR